MEPTTSEHIASERLVDLIRDPDIELLSVVRAIERDGIYRWDEFGRHQHFNAGSDVAKEAIQLLVEVAEHVEESDVPDPLDESELSGDFFKYRVHGWPQHALPDFDAIGAGMTKAPRPQAVARTDNARLAIIGALLDFIEGKLGRTYGEFKSENEFVEFLSEKMGDYSGLSVNNLKRQFKLARMHLKG